MAWYKKFQKTLRGYFDNEVQRSVWIRGVLKALPSGGVLLDAGCGAQPYRQNCSHLEYKSQDFGGFSSDNQSSFIAGSNDGISYGKLDYTGDVWDIGAPDGSFDYVLCSEVLEHIPYPAKALAEFGRILKTNGKLILTVPSNCLRHMDPYFYFSGFSDRWLEHTLKEQGFSLETLEPVGDYYSWIMVELARTWRRHKFFGLLLLPGLAFYFAKSRRPTKISQSTLCMGYHVLATKL